MRVWADVYDSSGARVVVIDEFISVNASTPLDGAGDFSLTAAVAQSVVDYLILDNEIVIWGQEDTETPIQWIRGRIIKPRVQESGDNVTISISGRDLMEELRWKTVGLGRSYEDETLPDIMDDLIADSDGWTASVEAAHVADVQTARFDGTKVLKAILKSVEQLGLHVRLGTETRLLEVGAFGDRATTVLDIPIRVMHAPSSVQRDLYDNDAVLLVDSIGVTEDGDTLCNWAIPMGAGEGAAATTLQYTTYKILNTNGTTYQAGNTPAYPLYQRTNAAGIQEFYIDASDGATQHQDTLAFREIGPVANTPEAKALAADALANACIASLRRTRTPITSYSLTVRKVRTNLRPGDMIHVTYKGIADVRNSPRADRTELVYIDIDDDFWIMGVQRSISGEGISTTLQVNTIDQHIENDSDVVVNVFDRSQVNHLSVQNFPFVSERSSTEFMGRDTITDVSRPAKFTIKINDIITDLIQVKIHFRSSPFFTTTRVLDYDLAFPFQEVFELIEGNQHPKDVHLYINGVDVSAELGGPWNQRISGTPGTPWTGSEYSNGELNETLDITTYIVNASGTLYSSHEIAFYSEADDSADVYNIPNQGTGVYLLGDMNGGMIELNVMILGVCRTLKPS